MDGIAKETSRALSDGVAKYIRIYFEMCVYIPVFMIVMVRGSVFPYRAEKSC